MASASARPGSDIAVSTTELTPVTTALAKELSRYETVRRVASWPLVANTADGIAQYYHSTKKQNEMLRVVFAVCEAVLSVWCRLILLPWARSPFARTPAKIADYFGNKSSKLLERAAPRLKDKVDPLNVDGELLVTTLFLPITMCLAVCHKLLEKVVDKFVSVFPPLREAARDYDQKGLLGQWVTLLLMMYVYLPLQFISHPSETIQQAFSIPSRFIWAVVNWNVSNVLMCVSEVSEWLQWTRDAAAYCFYTWLGLVITAAEYWYYFVFKATGLERYLYWGVQNTREYLETSDTGVARIVHAVGQTPAVQWTSDVLGNSDLALVRMLRSLWFGADEREELKKHRRTASRTVRISSPERARDERGRSPRHATAAMEQAAR